VNASASLRGVLAVAAAKIGGDEAAREAELLLAHALGRNRAWLIAHAGEPPDAHALARFEALLARRASGEPIAYILGRREFWSLDLAVGPGVLIPRGDTEALVEIALQHIPQDTHVEIADLGTGSGAIALALARERPQARVLATDVSSAALDVARSNAQRLAIANIEFATGDWCAALGTRRFHLIASNPPYIAAGDPHLRRGDLRHEPLQALVSGSDGLDAIRTIVRTAPAHLYARGWLVLEHGHDQGAAVRALLQAAEYANVFTADDLEGRERVSGGCRSGSAV
jgi:release factor glutamine methyltransferase